MGLTSIYHTQKASLERELTQLVCQAMDADFELVSVTFAGRRVSIQGTAPSYIAKARAAEAVRRAGYSEIANRLRVVPGLAVLH